MEIRDLLTRGVTLIVDPRGLKTSLDDFFASYGGYLEYVVAVVKDTSGRVYYSSKAAPVDEEYPTFFSEFIDTTEAVGIRSGAYVNVFADAFFAADQEFKSCTAEGQSLAPFVCPNQSGFIQHMVTVIKEIVEMPVHTLFLSNLGYANAGCCYCNICREEFSEYADLRHTFQIADPAANPALHNQWIEWRVAKMTDIVQQLVNAAKDVKAGLKVIPTYPIDFEGGFVAGTRTNLGLDLESIAKMSKNLAIEVFPWTPILPDPGSKDYNVYIDNLSFVSSLKKMGVDFSMIHWIIEDEVEYNRAKALADGAGITDIYSMLGYPVDYQTVREIRLGLVR
ncbi:MAG: hypothetical protein ACFFD8_05685 [Candidatus Thorarchaeota archaeon]